VEYALSKDFPKTFEPSYFVLESIKYSLGKSESQAARIHALIISSGLFQAQSVVRGLQMCVAGLPDLSLDHPNAPRALGSMAGAVHRAGLMELDQLWSLFDTCVDGNHGSSGTAKTALTFALSHSFRDNLPALAAAIAAQKYDPTTPKPRIQTCNKSRAANCK
jgi:hypothetical protein